MSALQISPQQTNDLSDDLVRRHARTLTQRVDAALARAQQAPAASAADMPPDAARLQALRTVLRADLEAQAGPAAGYLAVDLDHCGARLMQALQAGATYRETGASALMQAAALLGARWLGDLRLWMEAADAQAQALQEPRDPAQLRQWADASWAARFELARRRNQLLIVPIRYALLRADECNFSAEALRAVADAVFRAEQVDSLRAFLTEERSLLAAAGLDSRQLGDRRVESVCMAGDLGFGLGRFVRLASTAFPTNASRSDADSVFNHLRKALHALAESPEQ